MLNYGSSCRVGSSYIKYEITAKFFYKKTVFNQLQKFQTKNCNTYMSEYINKKKSNPVTLSRSWYKKCEYIERK